MIDFNSDDEGSDSSNSHVGIYAGWDTGDYDPHESYTRYPLETQLVNYFQSVRPAPDTAYVRDVISSRIASSRQDFRDELIRYRLRDSELHHPGNLVRPAERTCTELRIAVVIAEHLRVYCYGTAESEVAETLTTRAYKVYLEILDFLAQIRIAIEEIELSNVPETPM